MASSSQLSCSPILCKLMFAARCYGCGVEVIFGAVAMLALFGVLLVWAYIKSFFNK